MASMIPIQTVFPALDIQVNLSFVNAGMDLIPGGFKCLLLFFPRINICNSSEEWRFEMRFFRKRKRNLSLSQRPKFSKRIRGYDTEEVSSYLRQMTDEMHALSSKNIKLTREKSALEEKCAELNRQIAENGQLQSELEKQKKYQEELEGLLKGSLKDLAGINQDTKVQTEKFISESKNAANQIIAKAEKESERILSKATEDVQNLEQKILHLEFGRNKNVIAQAEYYRAQFRLIEHEAEALGIDLRPIEAPESKNITPLAAQKKTRKKA